MMKRKDPIPETRLMGRAPANGVEVAYPIGMPCEPIYPADTLGGGVLPVDMSPNDGDNGPAVQAPFANGSDMRVKGGSSSSGCDSSMPC